MVARSCGWTSSVCCRRRRSADRNENYDQVSSQDQESEHDQDLIPDRESVQDQVSEEFDEDAFRAEYPEEVIQEWLTECLRRQQTRIRAIERWTKFIKKWKRVQRLKRVWSWLGKWLNHLKHGDRYVKFD